MDPTCKLYYFNGRGRAENIRFVLAYAGVKYEDIRFTYAEWPKYKKELDPPYGQVPVLEIDGKKLSHTNAILRYLARQYNLMGKNDWESVQCDEIVYTVDDLGTELWKFVMEKDESKKDDLKTTLKNEKIPQLLGGLEKKIVQNKGFSVGTQLTWSDIRVSLLMEGLELYLPEEKLEKYPGAKRLKEKVFAIPSIAAWVKKRPDSTF